MSNYSAAEIVDTWCSANICKYIVIHLLEALLICLSNHDDCRCWLYSKEYNE